ncbi:MAG: hypothetical protein K9K65_04465 [Desulfarculaceae bacterium]|nr:hypothetical protein [Desulfarculaceae bacterium]MCF8046274.1 hypothetical protein [Desulfarculaceae bacterium]MCF8066145.1 hypothetical protein [Desulfarculaceae bacterium]MCF8097075.1 hypothetical protein [Desulfarculaceae bacterium]MCF8120943.1 hypothetical protein [Desulfarculaceae bacterium]
MDETAARIFRDKPEALPLPPAEMLPPAVVKRLRRESGVAVVELAGRDSVAAALRAAREMGLTTLVPTYVYTGSEHGSWDEVPQAWQRLRGRLPAGVELTPLLVMGSPRFWRALNGRYLQELTRRFGFCPVCPGCHLYLHAARIPLAKHLGGVPVVAGERLSHDGRDKLNQVAPAQEAYQELYRGFGLELALPLAQVTSGREIEDILGLPWPEGGDQLGCVFSGNYLEPGGALGVSPDSLTAYFQRFALPLAQDVTAAYLDGQAPEHLALAGGLLAA